MIPKLPNQSLFIPKGGAETNGSDQYGALHVAAEYAGVKLPEIYLPKALWHHGVFGPWFHFSRESLVFVPEFNPDLRIFVARRDQVDFIKRCGYRNVEAIGLPFIYVPSPGLKRVNGSLLVMPGHSLAGMSVSNRSEFAAYAAEVKQEARNFPHVTVCLHPSCLKSGFWVREFEALGFTVIEGARTHDLNALFRMKSIFEQYEFVTTNVWGSHVAYALASGCKVSIYGRVPKFNSDGVQLFDAAARTHPERRKIALSDEVEKQKREFLEKFYVRPTCAVSDVELGNWFLGTQYRISRDEMAVALGEMTSSFEGDFAGTVKMTPGLILNLGSALQRLYANHGIIGLITRLIRLSLKDVRQRVELSLLRDVSNSGRRGSLRIPVETNNDKNKDD